MMVLVAVLCAGCGKDSDDGQDELLMQEAQEAQAVQPTVLTIYVYAPESPMVTRADVGNVTSLAAENVVRNLHVWVFEHESGTLVGYLNPSTTTLNDQQQEAYLMSVSTLFVQNRPNVDVYVMANAEGLSVGENSSRDALDAAIMPHAAGDAFGIVTPTTSVPATGLPMSGVLRNQPVYGDSPVLRIGSVGEIATVQLVRTVSKLHFVFSRSDEADKSVTIDGITLADNLIPQEEFLFLADDGNNYHVGSDYETATAQLATNLGEIGTCSAPTFYVYTDGMDAQTYENLVESGVEAHELTQAGPYYLRESNRWLRGIISYSVDGESRQASFYMAQAGDFTRNHTWTVYGYFASAENGDLELNSLFVRDWSEVNRNHELYNW